MPLALVDKIKRSRTFNQGDAVTEYVSAALLDMAWHSLPPDVPLQDVNKFEAEALKRFHVDLAQVPPRYHRLTSRTFGTVDVRRVTTRISGARCLTMTRSIGSKNTAD